MFFIYYDWLYILLGLILVPGLILGIIAEAKFKSTTAKYNKTFAMQNITGHEMAEEVLKAYGISNVKVVKLEGSENYADYYDSKNKTLALSEAVYNSSSITALGVAAHEVGHAIQDKEKNFLLKLRTFFGITSKFGSVMLIPLLILGVVFSFLPTGNEALSLTFIISGFALFGTGMLFSLVTLPIELDASRRTQEILVKSELLNKDEYEGAKKVLNAAALTYVAALVNSILNFLRILIYFLIKTKKRD